MQPLVQAVNRDHVHFDPQQFPGFLAEMHETFCDTPTILDVHEQVEVTSRSGLATRIRAKDAQVLDAVLRRQCMERDKALRGQDIENRRCPGLIFPCRALNI